MPNGDVAVTVESQTPDVSSELTMRQRLLIEGVANGLSVKEAGQLAQYKSRTNAYDVMRNLRERLLLDFEEIGVTTKVIALKIKEKLDAKETKLFAKDGRVTDAVDLEAHGVQLDAVRLYAMVTGIDSSRDSGPHIGTVNIMWTGNAPSWTQPATADGQPQLPNDNNAQRVTDTIPVKSVTDSTTHTPTLSAVEGTGAAGGASTHAHCPNRGGSSAGTLAQRTRVVKKRGPRLPVYRGPK